MNLRNIQMPKSKLKKSNFEKLTSTELDLLKFEVDILEQRILHLENLQYRLRQFSMALWITALGVGIGVTTNAGVNLLILGISGIIPMVFIILDAKYATHAQGFRSRRNEITYFLNTENYVRVSEREKKTTGNNSFLKSSDIIYWFDFQGNLSLRDSKIHKYRSNLIVKLTRATRVGFYGFQMMISTIVISNYLACKEGHFSYYFILLIFPTFFGFLISLRYLKRRKCSAGLSQECKNDLRGEADRYRFPGIE